MSNIKEWLKVLGFTLNDDSSYIKTYKNCSINVSLDYKVTYPSQVTIERRTSCDLNMPESLVVLDCLDRLFSIGYPPSSVTLEKGYRSGHKNCYLDVLVKTSDNRPYLLIECKTFGAEYIKSKKTLLEEGGQLLSYLVQEPSAQLVCLYTSDIKDGRRSVQYDYLQVSEELKGSLEELYMNWDKRLKTKGLLDLECSPYQLQDNVLTYLDLRDITQGDGGVIFNQFNEILRRHIVSDKTNAFNKIFNLFICKIKDEDLHSTTLEPLNFQWKDTDNEITFFERLSNLYKQGSEEYLNTTITDISTLEFMEKIKIPKTVSKEIETWINELRFFKNTEFSFKEVYNEATFLENALVVKEVVQLLSPFKLRYTEKQQYLGDFFEKLLNTGIKQESGQFFTPIPLAHFICKSLPVEQIIEKKNASKEQTPLPYVIDYASGSGHFLTEMMMCIDDCVKQLKPEDIKGGKRAKELFESHQFNLQWTKEYIYGIEKDYRLAKTTKVSSFLNGDGDATILCADGLAPFQSDKYRGKLQSSRKNNNSFDIVVANPPYSVSGFKNTLQNGENNFTLYSYLNDRSNEIECLFVERTFQLLKNDGVAGLILPYSFLTDLGEVTKKARELLLLNFKIKCIVTLGTETFMATPMRTVILFLQKTNLTVDKEDSVLIVNLDFEKDKKTERRLLGYEFSNRRGQEGIKVYEDGKLKKISHYVKLTFTAEKDLQDNFQDNVFVGEDSDLQKIMSLYSLKDIVNQDNTIALSSEQNAKPTFLYPTTTLSSVLRDEPIAGKRPKGGVGRITQGVLSIGGRQLDEYGSIDLATSEYVTSEFAEQKCKPEWFIQKNDVLVCKDGARTGKVVFVPDIFFDRAVVNEHVFILRTKNDKVIPEFLFYYLYSTYGVQCINWCRTKGAQGGLNKTKAGEITVPVVPIDLQQRIIDDIKQKVYTNNDPKKKRMFVDNILEDTIIKKCNLYD